MGNDYWTIATTVCTNAELELLRLRDRGLSRRTIALATGRHPSTVRDILWNADRKIELALRKEPAA